MSLVLRGHVPCHFPVRTSYSAKKPSVSVYVSAARVNVRTGRSASLCVSVGTSRRSTRLFAADLPTTPPRPDTAGDDAFCTAPYVEVSNPKEGPSMLTIELGDFPGLLRLIAWSLNGLDVHIVRAKLSNKNGIATDTFWVTDMRGKQIADTDALRDRLVDILTSCIEAEKESQVGPLFTAGPVTVDNGKDDGTIVTLKANQSSNSELLELASLLNGLNFNIEEAEICNDAGEECAMDIGPGVWRFKITRKGKKLDNTQAASLAYAVLMATNKNHALTDAPI